MGIVCTVLAVALVAAVALIIYALSRVEVEEDETIMGGQ